MRFRHGNSDIYVRNTDGSGKRNLTPDERPARIARDGSPSWSPDGRLIAFLSNRDNDMKIYVMTADGRVQGALGTFVDEVFAVGRISRSAGDVRFSPSVPRTRPQWENGPIQGVPGRWTTGTFLIRRSLVRGQAAEVMIYWTAIPGAGQVAACSKLLSPALARSSIDDMAAALAKAEASELVAGPTRVSLGGRPARYVELVVREDRGCDPGFFPPEAVLEPLPFFAAAAALWGGELPGGQLLIESHSE